MLQRRKLYFCQLKKNYHDEKSIAEHKCMNFNSYIYALQYFFRHDNFFLQNDDVSTGNRA